MTNLLDINDIQKALKIKKTKAYELVNSAGFPSIKIGRTIRVPEDEFDKWVTKYVGKQYIM